MKKLGLTIVLFASLVRADIANENQSIFSKKQKIDTSGVEIYETNYEMKSHKQFGAGISVGGATGLLTLNAEINLDPAEALVIGLGAGTGYGTFGLGWKHNYEANYLSPYTKVSYSKWFNSSTSSGSAADSDILKRIFSDNELRSGKFDADFIVGGAGVEYNQLEGDLAGVNIYGEVMMMAELRKSTFIPSGAIGVIYYY